MERQKCNICLKRFINGRALNGHLRSHLLNHDVLPPNTQNQEDDHEIDEAEKLGSDLREDPKKADPEFSSALEPGSDSVILQDRESDTDSSKSPIPRRSKRIRRRPEALENLDGYSYEQNQKKMKIVLPDPEPEPEPVSSISWTSPDEDVAYCLMSMKNDKWVINDEVFGEDDDEEEEEEVEEEEEEEEEEEAYSDVPENKKIDRKNRGKYKCETCDKVFRSYQALGGHRASHKKTRTIPTFEGQENDDPKTAAEEKIHECPVCYRVFASGQALGGHKRSHVIAATPTTTVGTASIHRRPPPPPPATRRSNETMIDLNLPAPVEDDEIISKPH